LKKKNLSSWYIWIPHKSTRDRKHIEVNLLFLIFFLSLKWAFL